MKISSIKKGEGKDLVFLHGYLASKECFLGEIEYFSKFFSVTAFDFPGFGGSDPIPSAWSVGDYADFTEEYLKEEGIKEPYCIAHSFGGRVAIKLLERGVFSRAVLCGCAGIRKKRGPLFSCKIKTYRLVRKFAPSFAERHFGSEEYRTLSPLMKESYKKIVGEDLLEESGKITSPVLFITGENDRSTPPYFAELYCSRIKNSRKIVLKGCGHFAFLDDPLAFRLAAEEFFHG